MADGRDRGQASDRSPLVLQREDARRNRERIVAAAESTFRQEPRASIERVASAAGVSRSTLYRHFQTREDLVAALAERASRAPTGRPVGGRVTDVRLAEGNSGQGLILAAPPGAGDLEETGLAQVRPAGQLGAETPLVVDATHVLNEVPPHLVAEQLVAEAQRIAHVPVALYVIDVDGSYLRRLAGGDEFPYALEGPLSVGPEIAPDALPGAGPVLALEGDEHHADHRDGGGGRAEGQVGTRAAFGVALEQHLERVPLCERGVHRHVEAYQPAAREALDERGKGRARPGRPADEDHVRVGVGVRGAPVDAGAEGRRVGHVMGHAGSLEPGTDQIASLDVARRGAHGLEREPTGHEHPRRGALGHRHGVTLGRRGATRS